VTLWYEGHGEEQALPVRFEPCPQYRIPLEGDLLTCADCGWFISEHEASE